MTQPARRPAPGQVIDLAAYRRSLAETAEQGEWHRLLELVPAAWVWRDPESLAALEACVVHLKAVAVHEWEDG